MTDKFSQFIFFLEVLIYASVIFMHLSKKSFSVAKLYLAQSLLLVIFLSSFLLKEFSLSLFGVILLILVVKVIVSPLFFFRLVRRHGLRFSVSTYLNVPMTLVVLTILTGITYSSFFAPLLALAPESGRSLPLALATMVISLFLIINRRGALSQMIGILSLENAIVLFASIAGLEQSPGLQIGLTFDILAWVIIATVFISMIYKQFGSLDVTSMQRLKEE